jgi:predicted PurR-regulated permease PerM
MAFPDRRTLSVLMTTLLFAVVLAIVYVARGVLIIFIISILFTYLIDPLVRFLQSHSLFFKNLRGPHVLAAYLALLILIAFAVHVAAPGSIPKAVKLFREAPAFYEGLSSGDIANGIGDKYGWTDDQKARVKSFLVEHRAEIRGFGESFERTAPAVIGGMLVIPILAIFFLSDGANLANSVIQFAASVEDVEYLQSLAAELNVMLRHYIRAKVTLCALAFLFYSVTALLLRFPHALALGLMGGLFEFIPIAGWMISATAILVVGVLTHAHWMWMAALIGMWRVLIDYWISPAVMGHELEMHPLLEIFTVMVGGAVGGIIGVYLSVPLVAALRVVWRQSIQLKSNAILASPPIRQDAREPRT